MAEILALRVELEKGSYINTRNNTRARAVAALVFPGLETYEEGRDSFKTIRGCIINASKLGKDSDLREDTFVDNMYVENVTEVADTTNALAKVLNVPSNTGFAIQAATFVGEQAVDAALFSLYLNTQDDARLLSELAVLAVLKAKNLASNPTN